MLVYESNNRAECLLVLLLFVVVVCLLFDCELLHYSLLFHISYERKFDIIHTFFIAITNVEKFRNCKQSCILYDYPISVRGIIFESGKSIS